ncbi:MAG: 3-oxoacyl-ACP reductase FabG [Calditrichaceae bacterium]
MFNFESRNILVTGGSRGIGAAIVKLFSQAGANVAFNYNKNYRAASELAESCSANSGTILFDECDVSDYQETKHFVDKMLKEFGSIDTLVNNAGIWEYGKVDEMKVDEWRRTIQINLDSVYYFSSYIVKQMRDKNIKGHIVNISSTAGQRGEAFYSHYAATKGAIISFTKSLATELGPDGIHVNCVAPGWVITDMSEATLQKDRNKILSQIPLGFIADPEDIAGPVAFLVSDFARAITGEILNVNCGNVLCG